MTADFEEKFDAGVRQITPHKLIWLHDRRKWAFNVFPPRAELGLRIREAFDRYRLHSIADRIPADLDRHDRATHEWLTSLRAIGSSSTTKYRGAATSPDDLARVVSDQSADVAARAAAAVALDAVDQNAAQRIREIASHTANPKLRIALERVADHAADAEIEASLEELSNARAR